MQYITHIITVLIISVSTYSNASILEENNTLIQQKNIAPPLVYSFSELVNPIIDTKYMDNLLTRRKGDIKYSEFKVYWKKFIENLDKKRQNPDQVMLDKKRSLT